MNLKGYVSVRSPVPVGVQNMVVRDYCVRHNHRYSLSDVEFLSGFHMLEGFVWYLHLFDGICAYSMHIFPEDEERRDLICEAYADKEIHFALENYVLPRDRAKCEEIWRLKSLLK